MQSATDPSLAAAAPRVVMRLPDLDRAAVIPDAGAAAGRGDAAAGGGRGDAETRGRGERETGERGEEGTGHVGSGRRLSALLVQRLAKRPLRPMLSTLATLANVVLILQQPKVWLAGIAALFVQLLAALIFSGPAELEARRSAPGFAGPKLPPAAGANSEQAVGPVEIVVPESASESAARTALAPGWDHGPALPGDFNGPMGDVPGGAAVDRPLDTGTEQVRLAERPNMWPSFGHGRRDSVPAEGMATLEGIELTGGAGASEPEGSGP